MTLSSNLYTLTFLMFPLYYCYWMGRAGDVEAGVLKEALYQLVVCFVYMFRFWPAFLLRPE